MYICKVLAISNLQRYIYQVLTISTHQRNILKVLVISHHQRYICKVIASAATWCSAGMGAGGWGSEAGG